MLLSSSRVHPYEPLEHVRESIRTFLDGRRRVLFVPYALADHDGYAERIRAALDGVCDVVGVHEVDDRLDGADAVFVGGGNTFRLLSELQNRGLLDGIRNQISNGTAYIGSSAGTNLACPTIRTTNDMPIVEPAGLSALGLVPFQINAHFVSGALAPTHSGESREQRIAEFHEENVSPVVGLPEASRLVLEDDRLQLSGDSGATLFEKDNEAIELRPGADLTFLMHPR